MGGGGANGDTGLYWTYFFGCWPLNNYGGAGGAGSRGGRGGIGGPGGNSGTSGRGGDGGLAAPGMVKLHGSVVLAAGGTVTCNNHSPISTSDLTGRYTTVTNLASAHITLPTFSDDIVTGTTTNNAVLRAPAPYNATVITPLIPQLEGGTATGGFCLTNFWNQSSVVTPGIDRLEVVDLGSSTPFEGFRQIFLVNNGGGDATDVVLRVQGSPAYVIGVIPDGKIWTTCVTNAATFTVDVGMDITIAPETADLYVGEPLTLTATVVGGRGDKTYLWLRDTEVVHFSDTENFYAIPAVTALDAGTYEVYVNDQTHPEESDNVAVVTVDPPINITVHPVGETLIAGDTTVLTVFASGGKGALHYDWRKNTVSLGAPSAPFLSLGPVSGADAGDYDVVVTDALGLVPYGRVTSDTATIVVNSPLAVAGPNDATVYDDAALVTFQITASGGVPPYTYSWRKDDVLLEDLVPPIPQPGAPLLELTQPLQPGLYRCTVTDSDGPPTVRDSGQGRLTVHPHLALTAHPQSVGVNPGEDVTLEAAVTGGIPPLIYTWRKDMTPLPPGEQPGGPVLTLFSVDASDAGDYDLVVEDNGTDEVTSDPASVVVRDTPLVFTLQPEGVTRYADEGDYLLEAATSGGEGIVVLAWWYDDGLGGGPVPVGVGPEYTIASPSVADSGDYWCVATDDVGSIKSDVAQVRFGDRIAITQQPVSADRYVDEGDYTLEIAATGGLDALTFHWYLDSGTGALPVLVGSGLVYTVPAPPESSHGWYFCLVSDGVTEVQSDFAEVLFAQHMAFTSQPRGGEVRKGESFTFSVGVSGGLRELHYIWKRDTGAKAAETIGPDAPEYTIDETELSDTGYYWVEVFDLEESITSDAVYLLVSAGVPVGGLFGLAALAGAIACAAAAAFRRRK